MKLFAISLLAAASAALEAEDGYHDHYSLNSHYDNSDPTHYHYGSDQPASPAYPTVPKFGDAVDAFDPYGTLFGEHRYQLQVMKTGNMLIGTEAIRESIASLQDRVHRAHVFVHKNDDAIAENDRDIEDNRQQIIENRGRLATLDSRIHDLEGGYADLHHKLAVDREALIMMCHQYAYAETIPHECIPIIGGLNQPIHYQWNWPTVDCPGPNALPPFNHPLNVMDKITSGDEQHPHPIDPHAHPHDPHAHY